MAQPPVTKELRGDRSDLPRTTRWFEQAAQNVFGNADNNGGSACESNTPSPDEDDHRF